MAKEPLTPEEKVANAAKNTVPYYKDGEFVGYTTPELAGMAQADDRFAAEGFTYYTPGSGQPVQPDGPYLSFGPGDDGVRTASPGTNIDPRYVDLIDYSGARDGGNMSATGTPSTGYDKATGTTTVFNPLTGGFDVIDTKDNPLAWNPSRDLTNWAQLPNGDTVLMRTDLPGWEETGARVNNGDYSDWTWGAKSGQFQDTPLRPPTTSQPAPTPTPTPTPPPTTRPPTTPPIYTPPPTPPGVSEPTDDWFTIDWDQYPGYEDLPPPTGDGSVRPVTPEDPVPPDTSWNWDYFRQKAPGDRQWGGYDQDYQAFERYQPGMESPWGMPNIRGGNTDFYQQQFVNMLRDEQGFRNRQREAQLRAAEYTPAEAPTAEEMWGWAYGGQGLPEVVMGTGQKGETTSVLADQFNENSTFGDMIRFYAGQEGFSDYKKIMNEWLKRDPSLDSTWWSRAGSAENIISKLGQNAEGLTPKNREWLTKMANAVWQPGQAGPYAPADYASPIQWGGNYQSYAAANQTPTTPLAGGQVQATAPQALEDMSQSDILSELINQAPEIDWQNTLTDADWSSIMKNINIP